jgi:hypothetical protein
MGPKALSMDNHSNQLNPDNGAYQGSKDSDDDDDE